MIQKSYLYLWVIYIISKILSFQYENAIYHDVLTRKLGTLLNIIPWYWKWWWLCEREIEREKILTCGQKGQGEGFHWKVEKKIFPNIDTKGNHLHSNSQGNHWYTCYTRTLQYWLKKRVAPTMRTIVLAVACRK